MLAPVAPRRPQGAKLHLLGPQTVFWDFDRRRRCRGASAVSLAMTRMAGRYGFDGGIGVWGED